MVESWRNTLVGAKYARRREIGDAVGGIVGQKMHGPRVHSNVTGFHFE